MKATRNNQIDVNARHISDAKQRVRESLRELKALAETTYHPYASDRQIDQHGAAVDRITREVDTLRKLYIIQRRLHDGD